MKITDSDAIKNSEKELIDAITGELDWSAIEKLLREKHNIGLQDDVEFRNGDLTVFKNQIAYKLDFDVKITLSVVFDRLGNCLKLTAAGDEDADDTPTKPEAVMPQEAKENENEDTLIAQSGATGSSGVNSIASEIAGMISEINNS